MTSIDYIVLAIYLLGILAVGCVFARVNKSSADMFAAGGQSPWWAAGLSSFMTMFSANTFVVWGGIAYKHGLVAVAINLGYGVAALLVGYFVAGHWEPPSPEWPPPSAAARRHTSQPPASWAATGSRSGAMGSPLRLFVVIWG